MSLNLKLARTSAYRHLLNLYQLNTQDVHSRGTLDNLPETIRQKIFWQIWNLANRPSEANYGEIHALDNPNHLHLAIRCIAYEIFDSLPQQDKQNVGGKIWYHSGSPNTEDRDWGEKRAKNDPALLLRSLDECFGVQESAQTESSSATNAAEQPSSQSVLSFLWNAFVDLLNSFLDCFCCYSAKNGSEQQRIEEERELASWQNTMAMPIRSCQQGIGNPNFIDLSGRSTQPGTCNALHMDRIPQIGQYQRGYPILSQLLTVKLPIRQLHEFPEAIKNEFVNYDAEDLDLYFIVWQDIPGVLEDQNERGKRNVIYHSAAYPNAQFGEVHNQNLSMGIFEAEGIDSSRGPANTQLPLNRFGMQNVHIHPHQAPGQPMVMCVSPDQARFYNSPGRSSRSFYSACKFPNNRAAAFFGVILNSGSNTLESAVLSAPLRTPNLTLQDYKRGIENSSLSRGLIDKIVRLLSFHSDN